MAHEHEVFDMDTHFIIDGPTHAIINAGQVKLRIFQGAHKSEQYTFELPKVIDGHDMTLCDSVTIHYINTDSATKQKSYGLYEVTDVAVSPDNPDKIIFTWTHTRSVTEFAGTLEFLIHFACTAADGTYDYEWPTEPFSGIQVVATFKNTETIVEMYPDILLQWKQDVIEEVQQITTYNGSVVIE